MSVRFDEVPEGAFFRVAPVPRHRFFKIDERISERSNYDGDPQDGKLILLKADAPCDVEESPQ